ncbi:hypothetical protein PCANC_10578 [Puccinia coronata f. sp. avenae]|uniref:Uncharacterized protein n=1 Tax=Puccinia coronata f. sp. avenae TaxID=200324 RepID=A0A2N5U5H3_9BASI|nr:hypothetical protein PCASD_26102 [Puccinia coronata f. sp. avenae]PLW32966.1 hypothetical protein PCASD_20107 [Puccinia coronata f. sp. avenae]PLW52514.1 hypothetical protein PCANC_10578 [Puccinia coronata f. sp. avenae]
MTFATTTSFSPLHIRSADTPPKPEKVITPGRELTREERKVARRRNGPMDVLPTYAGKRLTFTLPSATGSNVGQLNQSVIAPANNNPSVPSDSRTQSSSTPTTSKVSKLERNLKSPLSREIIPNRAAKPQSKSSDTDMSNKPRVKSIKGKEKAQPVSDVHGLPPPASEIPKIAKASTRPEGRVHVVKRKKEASAYLSDNENTPTTLNTPIASSSSSSDSGRMKTLAAKIFTPAAARKKMKGSRNVKEPLRKTDINSLFDKPATTQEVPKPEEHPPEETQQETGEEQIYIVADRLLRQEDSLEKSTEGDEELSLDTQRLLLKIKSQLNPPDIISISIRKLIQDELEKVDQRLHLLPPAAAAAAKDGSEVEEENEEDEQERIEAHLERASLETLLENFKAEMLQYSDQLVRYGLLKAKLQRLQACENDLQSQLSSSTPQQNAKRKVTNKKKRGP